MAGALASCFSAASFSSSLAGFSSTLTFFLGGSGAGVGCEGSTSMYLPLLQTVYRTGRVSMWENSFVSCSRRSSRVRPLTPFSTAFLPRLLRAVSFVARDSAEAPERRVARRVKCAEAGLATDFLVIRPVFGVLRIEMDRLASDAPACSGAVWLALAGLPIEALGLESAPFAGPASSVVRRFLFNTVSPLDRRLPCTSVPASLAML